jgi:uncharacterized membrane protein
MQSPSTHIVPVGMSKHRLELFTDGVFAIILTILVLDLKVPAADGLLGLKQATPSLLVHVLSFFVVSAMWMTHNMAFSLFDEITDRIIRINLFGLFWITLMPFGAKIASEHPSGSLGAFMMTLSYTVSGLALRHLTVFRRKGSEMSFPPEMRTFVLKRRRAINLLVIIALVCCALTFVSPWFGYFCVAFLSLFLTLTTSVANRYRQLMKASEPGVPAGG